MERRIYPLKNIKPGIQRDGTRFDSPCWTDGEWVRFQRGLPRKMGGYRYLASFDQIQRGIYMVPTAPNFNVFFGDSDSLSYLTMDANGNGIGSISDIRTPANFRADVNNDWIFEVMYDSAFDNPIILAFAAPNLYSIDNTVERPVFYGDLLANTPLQTTGFNTSGGMVSLHPYLFIYGNYGKIIVTKASNPTEEFNSYRATAQKIVYGLQTRGGNSSPAGIFWSLDSVIRVTNIGTDEPFFQFDTVDGQSSVLSSRSIIQYDSLYFWAGVDKFLCYNGTVNEVPNNKSINFFYDNINMSQRQKVWATKIPRFGEIWWHFPLGNSTECNHALIYNIRENEWYDTPIGRSDGHYDSNFSKPVWADTTFNFSVGGYPVWIQEVGVDQDIIGDLFPIRARIKSSVIANCGTGFDGQQQGVDRLVHLTRFEPDFVQTGDMTLTIGGRQFANSTNVNESPITFSPTTEYVDLDVQRRELTVELESNTVGGDFQMGQCLFVSDPGDVRP